MSTYPGYLYSSSGQRIYPSPRDSVGKYKRRNAKPREIKRSISQYDHAELVSLSSELACRIPSLRAAIRDKNSWAFSYWQPIYMGEDEKWGEAAEDYLNNEVLPLAFFRELRQDFSWAMKMSGMGLDMHGDDLAVFTEDEAHNPKLHIVPSPLIGSDGNVAGFNPNLTGALSGSKYDGMSEVEEGPYKGARIYNGMIRANNRWVAVRVTGYNDKGDPTYSDLPIDASTHFACETEFFGQGRGLPRIAASVLHWMNKEEIDDQFLKGLKNAAQRAVIHKLPPGMDALMAKGNTIVPTIESVTSTNEAGTTTTADETVWVEYTQDGNVQYIGADEELGGIQFENPHPNAEAFAVRVLMECLADLGWSWSLIDTSMVSRAPTRMETSKANNSMTERQSIQEIRSIRFFQYSIAKGMDNGRIPKNRNGIDPYKWGIGFPKEMSVDQGNDTKSALDRLRMGLTNERIEAAKEGLIAKRIRKDREKEVKELLTAAKRAKDYAASIGENQFTFEQAMSLFYQPTANPPQPQQAKADPKASDQKTP